MTDLAALDGATIAFDLDGTLVESAPDLIGAVNAILIAEGFEPLAYDQGRPFISRDARWLLQWVLPQPVRKTRRPAQPLFWADSFATTAHISQTRAARFRA